MESVFFHSFLGPRSWDKPDLALRAAPESLGTPVFCPRSVALARHAESAELALEPWGNQCRVL